MTKPTQVKPTFLVVGAEKSGTTSFCHQLAQHPQVFLSTPKEPHFFSRDESYEEKGMDWYYRLFEAGRQATAIGEGSVTYSYESRQDRVIPRLLKHLPDVRLIYIMRHPMRRIESVWTQAQSLGEVDQQTSFAEYVDKYQKFLFSNSCYWDRVNAFREHFSDERILLLFFEELTANPAPEYHRAFEFLGVDPDYSLTDVDAVRNRSSRLRDRPLIQHLKSQPALKALSRILPSRIRHRILKGLRTPIQPADWDSVQVGDEMEQLRQQSARILKHCQRPTTFWEFPDQPGASHG